MMLNPSRLASLSLFALMSLPAVAAPAAQSEFARASDPLAKLAADPPAVVEPKPALMPEASPPSPAGPDIPAATEKPASAAVPEPAAFGGGGDHFLLVRTLGGLGLVIGLIVLAFAAVRRYGPKYLRRQPVQRSLRIIESLPVGDKRSLSVIQFENMRLLVGNTPQQISLLAQLPSEVSLAEAPAEKVLPKEKAVATLHKLTGVDRSKAPRRASANIPPDLREKMRQLREAMER